MRDTRSPQNDLTRLLYVSGLLLCAAACVLAFQWSTGTGSRIELASVSSGPGPLGLEVTAAPTSKAGEPLRLDFKVTNRTGAPCTLASTAEGTVGLTVARDGARLDPEFLPVEYARSFSRMLSTASQVVAPGASVGFSLDSTPHLVDGGKPHGVALQTVAPAAVGQDVAAEWAMDAPGVYALSATYRMPRGQGACAGASDAVAVKLTIGKDCPKAGGLIPWIVGGLGGSGGAGLVGCALAARPVRRAVGRAVLAGSAAAGTALVGVALPATAHAEILYGDAGNGYFDGTKAALSICMTDYAKPGHDPENVLGLLNGPYPVMIKHGAKGDDKMTPHRTYAEITWYYFYDDKENDNCGVLYHELVHAKDLSAKVDHPEECDSTGIAVDEVRTTRAENDYRHSRGLDPLPVYGDDLLPPGTSRDMNDVIKDCGFPGVPIKGYTPVWHPGGACPILLQFAAPTGSGSRPSSHSGSGSAAAAAPPQPTPACGHGGLNGDPHMSTFDGRYYDFQTVGEFVLAEGDGLAVQARTAPFPDSRLATVATALGLQVGADRLAFSMDGDSVRTLLGGKDVQYTTAETRLPGGGNVFVDSDGEYIVTWPDGTEADIEPISIWGLRILLHPAAARSGRLRGLLGNDDGDPVNDLVDARGQVLPDNPGRDQLYGAFADAWRVTDATSILPYPPGATTATFTDKSFPDKPLTVADLDPARRDAARQLCARLGVATPEAQDACVIDLVVTGQPAFAAAATAAEWYANVPNRNGADARTVKPGGRLYDGAVAGGKTAAGVTDTFTLESGTATVVRLVDVTGGAGTSNRSTLRFELEPSDAADRPGFFYTTPDPQYRMNPGETYTLKVWRDDGDTGSYGFRVVTAKEHHLNLTLGQKVSGNLETPGRVDVYSFRTSVGGKLLFNAPVHGCDLLASVSEASEQPSGLVQTPVCPDSGAVDSLDANTDYVLVIWSYGQLTGDYSFTPVVVPA